MFLYLLVRFEYLFNLVFLKTFVYFICLYILVFFKYIFVLLWWLWFMIMFFFLYFVNFLYVVHCFNTFLYWLFYVVVHACIPCFLNTFYSLLVFGLSLLLFVFWTFKRTTKPTTRTTTKPNCLGKSFPTCSNVCRPQWLTDRFLLRFLWVFSTFVLIFWIIFLWWSLQRPKENQQQPRENQRKKYCKAFRSATVLFQRLYRSHRITPCKAFRSATVPFHAHTQAEALPLPRNHELHKLLPQRPGSGEGRLCRTGPGSGSSRP